VLAILESFGNFIEHGVSFLFLPTDFQALSFTSPRVTVTDDSRLCYFQTLQTAKRQNARISELTQAFQRYKPRQ
jgi:hypothetical protein